MRPARRETHAPPAHSADGPRHGADCRPVMTGMSRAGQAGGARHQSEGMDLGAGMWF